PSSGPGSAPAGNARDGPRRRAKGVSHRCRSPLPPTQEPPPGLVARRSPRSVRSLLKGSDPRTNGVEVGYERAHTDPFDLDHRDQLDQPVVQPIVRLDL